MPKKQVNPTRELQREVFCRFDLLQLRLLKATSHEVANLCRAVLRSEEWQADRMNAYLLKEELKMARHEYRLPLVVDLDHSMTSTFATIHALKLERRDARSAGRGPRVAALDPTHDMAIREICMEVHGHGIVTSVAALRYVLASLLRRDSDQEQLALHTFHPARLDGRRDFLEEPVDSILSDMLPCTEVRKGIFWPHHRPCWVRGKRCHEFVSVFTLWKEGLEVFS